MEKGNDAVGRQAGEKITCVLGKRNGMWETWKYKYMVPPALLGTTLSGGTFLERLEILPVIFFFLWGLLFLHPTGEIPICADISEIWGHRVSIICQSFTDPFSTATCPATSLYV